MVDLITFGGNFSPYARSLYAILVSIGYFCIFGKCGVKRIWAWIPVAREYHISLCAHKEKEGRWFTIITAISIILECVISLLKDHYAVALFLLIPLAGLYVTQVIYMIQIYHTKDHVSQ